MIPLQQARFLLAAHTLQQLPPPLAPEIAFAGRSNVGKSSLINRLLGRKGLVKTSSKPGKTQSLNFFALGDTLHFVDLPGYGYAQVSKQQRRFWGDLVAGYVEERPNLAAVVVIIDLRHELKQQDLELVDWLRHIGRPYLLVYTKADKLSRNQQEKNAALLDADYIFIPNRAGTGSGSCPHSVVHGRNPGHLWRPCVWSGRVGQSLIIAEKSALTPADYLPQLFALKFALNLALKMGRSVFSADLHHHIIEGAAPAVVGQAL